MYTAAMQQDPPRVHVSVDAGVADVRLARPDKRNGLDLAMIEALVACGQQLAADRRVRAVVLSGEGKAFCAGLDWAAFLAMGADGPARLLARGPDSPANLVQRACWIWSELAVPVIAAVHGHTLGGGLQLALACDIRLAAPDTQMSAMEIRYGLIPDMSASQTLLKLVRPDVARELIYTARVVPADEALALGLVTRVVDDPRAAALALAATIASHSPQAIRAAKALCNQAPDLDAAAALARETELQLPLLGTPNQIEAMQAALTRRPATFHDPE
jgi:enoyl-CoA hydratase/carnithine racemase